jgi:hypothetical protein
MSTHPAFTHLDRHVLRCGYDTLLDLPLIPAPDAHIWVATIWPDPTQPHRWGRLIWPPGAAGRGWHIAQLTHLGDVIEFGADTPTTLDRWYGYTVAADPTSLTLVGPYPTPGDAHEDGWASLTRWQHQQATRDPASA